MGAREGIVREGFSRERVQKDPALLERERREKEAQEARAREELERQKIERERAARIEQEAKERAMREAIEREAQEKLALERAKLDRERMDAEERQRSEREALEAQAREARMALEKAQRERAALERERNLREALEKEAREAREALERAKAERESLEREAREAWEREANEARANMLQAQREKAALEDDLKRAQEQPRSIAVPMDEMKMVKVTEVLEVDDERDIDEDYDEEDDEVTEDDKREKAKIALVMVDLWEPADNPSVTESALRKLMALSSKERNRKLIRIAGAVPILVDILKEADQASGLTPIQSLALGNLALLCRNVRNREEVRRFDGLRHILRIARVKDEKDLIEDLKCLKELSKNDRNKIILREGRLIEFLVPKVDKDNQPVQELCLDTLTIINLNDVKSQVITRDAGGIPPIMKLSRRAARCLGAVAQNNRKIQQMVRKARAIPTVVKMLEDPEEEVRKAAGSAVAALAEN